LYARRPADGGSIVEGDVSFTRNGPAGDVALAALREEFAGLPDDYLSFLAASDGGEGFLGDRYVVLWRAEEVGPFHRDYEVAEHAPELLLIGSDGGGEAIAFDRRETPWPVVSVPFIGMNSGDAVKLGDSFSGFIEAMARS
jgi:hypothetical protein